MTDKKFDEETLMAYADGELDHETSDAIEKAVQSDPALAQRLEAFAQTRLLAQKSFEPILNEPIPDGLSSKVEAMLKEAEASEKSENESDDGATIVAFKAGRPEKKTPSAQWFMPLAASIAVVAAGITGFAVGTSTQVRPTGEIQVAEFNQAGLLDALQTVVSGEEMALPDTGDRFRAIASFRDSDNDFCREFEVDAADRSTFVSVACLRDGEWKLQFTVAAVSQSNNGYAPASSLDALDAYLDAVGAGDPMSVSEEAEALDQFR